MWARDLAPMTRVNAVAVGPALSPNGQEEEGHLSAKIQHTLLRRRVDPDEVADAVDFLSAASSITGNILHVDSGQHLWEADTVA